MQALDRGEPLLASGPMSRPDLSGLPWIRVAEGAPYFVDETGRAWTPIGQNDALTWPELEGCAAAAIRARSGATWPRSGQRASRAPADAGVLQDETLPGAPGRHASCRRWCELDDLVALCRQRGPPPAADPVRHLLHLEQLGPASLQPRQRRAVRQPRAAAHLPRHARAFIKRAPRLRHQRWGGDGTVFAWDLWNEMHPCQGEHRPAASLTSSPTSAPYLRALEVRRHGRAHLQTASVFGPELGWKPWLKEPIFRHPAPRFRQQPLLRGRHHRLSGRHGGAGSAVGPAVGEALAEIADSRPVLRQRARPDPHLQGPRARPARSRSTTSISATSSGRIWPRGGAGGGMRWPNRHPHDSPPGCAGRSGRWQTSCR